MKLRQDTTFGTLYQVWPLKPLPEVAFFQEGPGLRKWQWTDNGMKVINVTNILGDGTVDVNNTDRFISIEEFETKYKHFAVRADDIVIASSGNTYGKVGRVNHSHLPIMMNTSVIRFHPVDSEELHPHFLYAFLRSHLFKNQMESFVIGSAQPNFGPSHLKRMVIPCPEISAQRKIAAILSTYDELIDNNLRRIKILEEMAQIIYREWFVKFHFPGHEHARLTDSALGRIPEGWKVITLGSLIAEHIGGGWGNDVEDDKHTEPAWVIRGTDIPDARSCSFSKVPFRYHTKSNLKSRRLMPGDIVFEVSGGSKDQLLGRSLYVSSELLSSFNGDPVICASFCKRIQPDSKLYASELLYLSFLDAYVSGEIKQYQVQSTGISNYKWSDYLEKVSRCVPPISLQERFRVLSGPLFSEIAALGRKNTTLRRTRDLLLPRLISGEVDVSELDIAVPEEASA